MVKFEKLEYSRDFMYINTFYNKFKNIPVTNKLIPISKLYEASEDIYSKVKDSIDLTIPDGFDFYNNTATNVFFLLEQSGLGVHKKDFIEMFTPRDINQNTIDDTTYTYYNLYNITSRPTNAFNSVNYAAIPQNDFFVEFDFDGYHVRLLCEQLGYELTEESAHMQLAKKYFKKEVVGDEEYTKAKQINFHALYGRIPEEYKDVDIFVKIQDFINSLWIKYEGLGVVNNPVSNKPFTEQLSDMNPQKLMNYLMQSLETSRNILILKDVLRYLQNKKTKVVLYTYDIIYNKIFVLYSKSLNEYICTYNVDFGNVGTFLENTILVHRKKESNTLYTINALNTLIKELNGGVLDTSYRINWPDFRNCVLLTKGPDLKRINTKLYKIIEL